MKKLIIDTRKSIFKPIEIEINGKTFEVIRVTREVLKKLAEFDRRLREGDGEAPYERLEFLIGKTPLINKLEMREVNQITTYITGLLYTPEEVQLPEDEKKVIGPGDKS